MDLSTLVFWLFTGATAIQLAAWWGLYARLARHPAPGPAPVPSGPVSVIICARNEAANLRAFLPAVLEQDFPEFEVIVVDDDSDDETAAVLRQFQEQHEQLRVIRIAPKTSPGKKQALEAGIAGARHERLVFTDADCRPAGPRWLRHIAGGFDRTGVEIVLGYAPVCARPGLLNRWTRFETLQTAMQYFSLALAGQPYMGVGRNLAWRKPVFERVRGFSAHRHIASGDDDLLVNAASNNKNTSVCLYPAAFVYSEGQKTWRGWLRQKRRHLSAGKRYKRGHQAALSLLAMSLAGHYFLLTPLLFTDFGTISAAFYALRMASAFLIYRKITGLFGEERLLLWFPLLDVLLAIYYAVFTPLFLICSDHLISWK